jgi:3-dehydroquinate dehydratase type I
MAELLEARDAVRDADMVELRLDGIADLDVGGALQGRHLPIVATCRPTWEGGRFAGSEEERRGILARALQLGAEFVDLEWRAGFDDLVSTHGPRVVLSFHDFDGAPSDLPARAAAMRATGAGTIKVAVATTRLCDTLPLRALAQAGNAVVIGMGESKGRRSRWRLGLMPKRWLAEPRLILWRSGLCAMVLSLNLKSPRQCCGTSLKKYTSTPSFLPPFTRLAWWSVFPAA